MFWVLSGLISLLLFHGTLYGQEKKLEKFFLSNSTISESRAPLYMAEDLKLFEKYGLDTKIVNIRGSAVNIASLMAGETKVAVANGTIAMAAAARGAPVVILATIGPTKYSLVANPTITSIRQLKGKTIGIGGFGIGDYFTLRRLLLKLGLSPENDVTLFPTGTTSSFERINIMMTGKVDAVMATRGNMDRIEIRGVKLNVLAGTEEQGVDVSGGDFFTTRQFLRTHPGQIKAMFKAISDAIKIGRENREVFYRAIRRYMREDNPQLLEKFYENHYFLGKQPHSARPLERALDLDMQDMVSSAPEFKGRRAAEFIDVTILNEVESEGYFSWAKQ